MVAVGTSGYSFRDWMGTFYPEGTKQSEMLAYYARCFPAVEINTTYYGIPRPVVFERMLERTGERFEFTVKAHRTTTHDLKDEDTYSQFRDAITPLHDSGRLAGVLAQFPWSFRNTGSNRRYLSELSDRYEYVNLFIEFRHNSWCRDEVFEFLRKLGMGFVSVDEPDMGDMMPTVAVATGDVAYIRFHGRNKETWWSKSGDRYDWRYTENELEPWIEKVEELEKSVWKLYAFFNNCHQGYAVRNAMMFMEMLKRRGLSLDLADEG